MNFQFAQSSCFDIRDTQNKMIRTKGENAIAISWHTLEHRSQSFLAKTAVMTKELSNSTSNLDQQAMEIQMIDALFVDTTAFNVTMGKLQAGVFTPHPTILN